ncbi:TPA: restriction endonuclease subunit S [Streptococcus suis]|nr:restriction endonuclease subunit S [Streptococcus suis]
MPNKDRNIPKRRFKEFENADAWEQRKLGEVATFAKGNGYSKKDLVIKGSPIILYGRLYTKYETVISEVDTFVSVEDNKNSVVYSEGGEVLVPASGESSLDIARASVVAKKGIILGGDINIIRLHSEIFPVFLALTISNGKQQKGLSKRAQGKSVVHLHNSDLKKVDLDFPSLPEQEAIGSFFSDLDQLITLHQRKLDKLKSVKQAYLSEMFPAEGERVPKRRFPGFTDDWELRKLGEIADVFDGTHQTPKYTNHGVMFLSVEDIATLKSEKYISLEDFEKEFKIFPEFNDVLMTRIGDIGTSNIVKTNDKIAYYVSLALIKPRMLESHFLNSIIQSKDFQNELWKRTLHIAFPKKINKGEISEVNLKFPSLPEQEAIGTFFSTLDQHITLHQRKLEKLKNLKKALLNELFVDFQRK